MRKPALAAALALVSVASSGCALFGENLEDADLQVYTGRHYGTEKVFEKFEEDTGVSVAFLDGDDAEMLERVKKDGESGLPDVYMTVDAGSLARAADEGVLESVDSQVLEAAVPEQYRDADGRWFGLARRARTVIYNPDKVDESDLDPKDTYGGLTDPKWKGRLCMRGTTGVYTASLVASLIDLHGRDKALEMVEGWVANDVKILGNDVEAIKAVDGGDCDVAIVNHYYLARQIADGKDYDVELYWASQEGAGVHENISGAGIVKTSDNKKAAQQLLEWLASPKGQAAMIEGNQEYAVNAAVKPEKAAASFGPYKPMAIDAAAYAANNDAAIDLLAEAGYN